MLEAARGAVFAEWQEEFVNSVSQRIQFGLTDKQREVLTKIATGEYAEHRGCRYDGWDWRDDWRD